MEKEEEIYFGKVNCKKVRLPATKLPVLYKYFAPPVGFKNYSEANLESLIIENRVRLSCNLEVNDPADSAPYFDEDFTTEDIEKYIYGLLSTSNPDVITEKIRRELSRKIGTEKRQNKFISENRELVASSAVQSSKNGFLKFGFTCMTEDWFNRLMWSHYAQSHTGVCIGFRTRPRKGELEMPFAGNFLPVKYNTQRPVWSMQNMMSGNPQHNVLKQTLLHKDEVWSYEKEWRYIAKIKDGALPHRGGDKVELGQDEISEVIFGLKSTNETKDKIKAMIDKSTCKPQLYQADFKEKLFDLTRNKI